MKMKILITLICIYFFVMISCNGTTVVYPKLKDTIYFNSFESASDTAGWKGYGWIDIKQDPSPNGGKQSLFIAGGCIIPHVQLDIDQQSEDGNYILQGWIKVLQNGGSISLCIADSAKNISIYSQDTVWTFYQSEDTLFCPADLNMRLEFMSGGFIAGGMLVDQIAVKRVN